MDYAQASAVGKVGERRVADSLRAEAATLGYRLLDNLLLLDDQTTSQLDHVLVDRFGILVIETKNYHALIMGKSDDKFWTACYSGKKRLREKFQNPLRQNDRHREMLHRVLGAHGRSLPPEYIQSLVVFAGGNLDRLGVDEIDRLRVVSDSGITDYLRARCGDFQPNYGALDPERVADLVSLLRSVNHADDPRAVALHGENVEHATRRFRDRFRRRPATSPTRPASSHATHVVYNQSGRYPDGSQHAPTRRTPRWQRMLRQMLPGLLVVAVGLWLVFAGGAGVIGTMLASSLLHTPAASQAIAPESPPQMPSYHVDLALQRLKEADPKTYRRLSNPQTPKKSSTRGLPTYTWQYLQKTSANTVSVRTISITLDMDGQIVGVSGD